MVEKPRVAAIIQARMGSSRLPGKVLMPLSGKPVLWHIVHRLRKCMMLDAIAITTSDRPEDDVLAAWCKAEGVPVFRGPEENVLQRYAIAVEALNPDVILRVTGDAPLIDPSTIDQVIGALIREDADYCTGDPKQPSIHEGFEPFSRRAMNRLLREAADDPVAVEHVSAYISRHPERFRHTHINIPVEHHISCVRTSVDTPDDLRFLSTIYEELKALPGEIDVAAVVQLIRRKPELLLINQHIQQKTAEARTFRLVIRCDGSRAIGLGHVVRCLALARQLRDHHGIGVSFAMIDSPPGTTLVREAGFPLDLWDGKILEDTWLGLILANRRADALLLDVRTDLFSTAVASWRTCGLLVATLDDPSERRLTADLAFYPPVPQLEEMSWPGFTGELLVGWDWIPLRPEFAHKLTPPNNSKPLVVITMGGSDPMGLSLLVLPMLDELHDMLDVRLILGRGSSHHEELARLLTKLRLQVDVWKDVTDMPTALEDADLAMASFGVTAYELAALGVPAVLLSITKDHARSAEALQRTSMAISLGEYSTVTSEKLVKTVKKMLTDTTMRQQMRTACRLIDGRGGERITEKMAVALRKQSSAHTFAEKTIGTGRGL